MSPEGLSILSRLRHIRVFNEGLQKPYFYMNMQNIIQTNAIHSNFHSLGSLGKFDFFFFLKTRSSNVIVQPYFILLLNP